MPPRKAKKNKAKANDARAHNAPEDDFDNQLAGAQEDRAAELMKDPDIVRRNLMENDKATAEQLQRLHQAIDALHESLKEQSVKITKEGKQQGRSSFDIDCSIMNMNIGTACFEIQTVRDHLTQIIMQRDVTITNAVLDAWTVIEAILTVHHEMNMRSIQLAEDNHNQAMKGILLTQQVELLKTANENLVERVRTLEKDANG
jgi:hypothetical protein